MIEIAGSISTKQAIAFNSFRLMRGSGKLLFLLIGYFNDDLRQLLYQQVAQAIPKSNQTSAEQQFLEKLNV